MDPSNFHFEDEKCVIEREFKHNTNFSAGNNGNVCVDSEFPPLPAPPSRPFCTTQAISKQSPGRSRNRTTSGGHIRRTSSKTRTAAAAAIVAGGAKNVARKSHHIRGTNLSTSGQSTAGCRELALSTTSKSAECFYPNGEDNDPDPIHRSKICYPVQPPKPQEKCIPPDCWQNGIYVRDECGSGIIPRRYLCPTRRNRWCKTPLSMYQATIGELGKRLLCHSDGLPPRDIRGAPPCNVCEYIFPPCRGYYRKYDCFRPCEEDYAKYIGDKKVYRGRVERYWEPCDMNAKEKAAGRGNKFAHHNAYLGYLLRRHMGKGVPCW